MLNFSHSLPDTQLVKDRHPFIVDRCRAKTVLHIGCVDAGMLEDRFDAGELLHQKLHEVATSLYGIDIDVQGIEALRAYGYPNLFEFDLVEAAPPEALLNRHFDVIVLSEVIEHLPNPGIMLERLKQFMEPGRTQLIVSVPNAFSVSNILSLAKNTEYVHPDHNYYFSFVTLNNTLQKAGYNISERFLYLFETDLLPSRFLMKVKVIETSRNDHSSSAGLLHRMYWRARTVGTRQFLLEIPRTLLSTILLSRSSWWGDGLIAICKL